MSDPRTDREIEQALADWAEQVAPRSAPGRLVESTFARTMGTRQARVYPWQRLIPQRRERSSSRAGFGLALALLGLMVALVVGGSFAAGVFRPTVITSPSPSPSASPTATQTGVPSPSLPPPISVVADANVTSVAPIALVGNDEFLWVLAEGGRIDQIDPATASVTDSVTFGGKSDQYNGLALNDAGLWATDSTTKFVYRFDTTPLALAANVQAGTAPKGVLANGDGVWAADLHGGAVLRIDPAVDEVAATITVGPTGASGPNWLAEGLGSIWVDIPNNRTIVRVDPVTDEIQATIDATGPLGFMPCGGMAINDDATWVTSCASGSLMARIDANSNTLVATIDMGGTGYNPIEINGFIWVSVDGGDAETGTLVRINPDTNKIDRVLVPSTPFGGGGDIVVAAGSVWVVDGYHNAVISLPMSAFGA